MDLGDLEKWVTKKKVLFSWENVLYLYEVSRVFQFEPRSLKIGNVSPNVSKIFN
jgi:hypothetical protein